MCAAHAGRGSKSVAYLAAADGTRAVTGEEGGLDKSTTARYPEVSRLLEVLGMCTKNML